MLAASRVRELLASISTGTILVVGDLMLDEYIIGDVHRISPEAPVPVVRVRQESVRLGGAGNVAANAAALGARVHLVGGVGGDEPGRRFRAELQARAIETVGVVEWRDRPTTRKTRVIAHNQQVVRFDREDANPVENTIEELLLRNCLDVINEVDGVVVSDYAKGCLTARLLNTLLSTAATRGIPVVIDPKGGDFLAYQPATLLTPNHHEAAQAAGLTGQDEATITEIGRRLLARVDTLSLLITRGESGMTLFERDRTPSHIPTVAREVYDVTGAGDTVSTVAGLAMAVGATALEAAILANHAAGIVVGKIGTATVTPGELENSFASD